jgi:hypothetical protein
LNGAEELLQAFSHLERILQGEAEFSEMFIGFG